MCLTVHTRPKTSPITFLRKEEIEKQFLGQLCELILNVDASEEKNYLYLERAFKREPGYKPGHILNPAQNWIDEYKYEKNWWSKGGESYTPKANQFVLVIDIIRDHRPGWSAVVLLEKNTFIVDVENLLLKKE